MAESRGLLTRASETPSPGLLAERRAAETLRRAELRTSAGVPPKFAGVDLARLPGWCPVPYKALARRLLRLLAEPKLVAVGGERGTGKTALACGLVNLCCDRNRPALYRTAKGLVDEIQTAPFETNGDRYGKDVLRNRLLRADVVVIDETGARDTWGFAELFGVIDGRYAAGRATVLVSNLSEEAMARDMGDSVWRRVLEGGGFVAADWERIEELKAKAGGQ